MGDIEVPEEFVNYEHPDDIVYGIIDPEIQELVYEINQTDWMCTTCSCQGHPESSEISVWSINALVVCICYFDTDKLNNWISKFGIDEAPERYKDRELLTRIGRLLHNKILEEKFEFHYESEKIDGWGKMKIKFIFNTAGERDAMIDVMREALREIEN